MNDIYICACFPSQETKVGIILEVISRGTRRGGGKVTQEGKGARGGYPNEQVIGEV